jgi:low temperature requirement protein LtrA
MAKSWWQPPRLISDQISEEERRVTWLELFYDLVYVATVIQLGNVLSDNVSALGFVLFVVLFIPIWWSWTGFTFVMNRFVVDDVVHRILIFSQIAFIALLAMSVQGAFGDLGTQFTLAYVGIRAILILLYVRAGRHVVRARPLTNRYARGFAIAALLWLASAFVPAPWRYVLWGLGMLVDFATPLSSTRVNALLPPDVPHMAERYGLFTIIVMGEAFVKVISNAPQEPLWPSAVLSGLFALVIVASLWWLYFDDVAGSPVSPVGLAPYVWIYSHLPVAIGLTAFGVGIKKLIFLVPGEPLADKYRLLIGGALLIYLVLSTFIDLVTTRSEHPLPPQRRAMIRLACAMLVFLLTLVGGVWPATLWIALVAVACIAPIVVDLGLDLRQRKGLA